MSTCTVHAYNEAHGSCCAGDYVIDTVASAIQPKDMWRLLSTKIRFCTSDEYILTGVDDMVNGFRRGITTLIVRALVKQNQMFVILILYTNGTTSGLNCNNPHPTPPHPTTHHPRHTILTPTPPPTTPAPPPTPPPTTPHHSPTTPHHPRISQLIYFPGEISGNIKGIQFYTINIYSLYFVHFPSPLRSLNVNSRAVMDCFAR